MKRRSLVSTGTLTRIRQEAEAAWGRRDLSKCIELLKRLNRLSPADPSVPLRLGRMHGLLYDYETAEKWFEKSYQLSPPNKKAEALANAGQQARDFYNPEIAQRYFLRAVNEHSASPETLVKAAEAAERSRRMDDAWSLVEKALGLDRTNGPAILAHAHLQRRLGKLVEAERELRPLLHLSVKPEIRVKAWYELGAVLDRQGRYDEAMQAFLQAKSLLHYEGSPHFSQRQTVWSRVRQMGEEVSTEILHRWYEFGKELQPIRRLALLGGHPRSGTTLLEQVLDSHADIVSAEETDNFMDYAAMPLNRRWPPMTPILKVLDSAPKDALLACRADYMRASDLCLGGTIGDRLLVDKNPSLTLSIPALVRTFPEIRLLIALRDPRDVVLSCFMQPFLPVQQVSSTFLKLDAAADEYVALMGTWLKLRSMLPGPFLEIRYEDMVEDLESVARKTLEFLGVEWDKRVLDFDEHARNKRVRSPTYADVTQKVFTRARGRWRNYSKFIEPLIPKLLPFLKAWGYE